MSMRQLPPPSGGPDPAAEIALLKRQLARERARRSEAEDIGERATGDLYQTIQELRNVQQELLVNLERAKVVHELGRELRLEPTIAGLRDRTATATARSLGADRCLVYVADPQPTVTDWSVVSSEPEPSLSADGYGATVQRLVAQRAPTGGSIRIHDLDVEAPLVGRALGVRAMALVPMWLGPRLVGAVVPMSVTPRDWTDAELTICEGVAHELGLNLVQVQAHNRDRRVRRLEEIDRAKDAFVSNVSHELRTPLASISGYLEMVTDGEFGPLSDELGHAIGVVSRNAARLRRLVEDLLMFSAYDGAGAKLDTTLVPPGRLVRDCAESLRPAAAAKDVDIEVHNVLGLHSIRGDRAQLERAMLNLMSNAVKFTPAGGLISICLANDRDGVVVDVTDTGIGIPAAEQHQVFTRFFRSSLSTQAEVPGTGLGLALAKTIVELHGGTVDLVSEEGKGTTVTVSLPPRPPD
ncbi:HAMP domain-containing sensor histidine kinase [Nocardioides sp. InS609-2]|uniref:sensor histidine kinase n=1 Tax=Nocardioides sp. InS609-2 TaxID=2760705 RepID=UPI0020BECD4F|nr:HAMP domain-containing sensor histidine kinase [Nocardioides sp. InS609-2]